MSPRLVIAIASAMLASGCATTPAPKQPVTSAAQSPIKFRAADFAWSTQTGRGSVEGQLTFRSAGKPYSCAATGVVLTPETPWTRERMEILYKSASQATLPAAEVRIRTPSARTGDYSSFVRHAACSSTGRFNFDDLPAGNWFAITVAKPTVATGEPDMAIMRRIEVRNGKAVSLKL